MKHLFDVDFAATYGVNAAILFENIVYWIKHNEANGDHFHDGEYWTYNSTKAFGELFPYLSAKQIRTAIDLLVSEDIIIKGCYNSEPTDRTSWYTLSEKGKCICRTGQMFNTIAQQGKSNCPTGQMYLYTDINNTDINNTDIKDNTPFAQKEPKHKYGEYGWVKLTDDEYKRLVDDYGEATVRKYIQKVDEYCQGNGNKQKYKDWNLTVRKFMNRDKVQKLTKFSKPKPDDVNPVDAVYFSHIGHTDF